MKKIGKFIVSLFIVIVIVSGCGKKTKEPQKAGATPTPTPTNAATVLDDKTVDGLKISNFNITYENGLSNVVAVVKNETSEKMTLDHINISLYDSEDTLLVETSANIGESIEAGASTTFTTFVTSDLRSAVRMECSIQK